MDLCSSCSDHALVLWVKAGFLSSPQSQLVLLSVLGQRLEWAASRQLWGTPGSFSAPPILLCPPGPVPSVVRTEIFLQSSRRAAFMVDGAVHWLTNFIIGFLFPSIQVSEGPFPNPLHWASRE